ncbi:MAG: diguanylate cyclase [Actinomycetota bacterium]|nr:diguanylate cyclase [Actinomycetota bacterium]
MRLGWRRRDVVGELSRALDAMADRLHAARDEQERTTRRLAALADRDPLTGVLNHRALHERLETELVRAERDRNPVSVLVLDVDAFKPVNDRLGHAAGDAVLRALSRALVSEGRAHDVAGRIGGDEFVLVLPGATAAQARAVAPRVALALAATAPHGVTLSAGAAEFPAHAGSAPELLELADAAMYRTKALGGDGCLVFSPAETSPRSDREAIEQARRLGLMNTIQVLAGAVDAKDGVACDHGRRVAELTALLAEAAGLGPDEVERLRTAGVLHDVGKVGVPDTILRKPGPLEPHERAAIERHSVLGEELVAGAGLPDVGRWVRHLHERVDGTGYPDGLVGAEIPFESRLLAVADALEAMTSDRPYRAALPLEAALDELEGGAGSQFDEKLVAVAVELAREGRLPLGEAAARLLTFRRASRGVEGLAL